MVFEYMEQDLDHFIRQCPAPGMVESTVKVKLIFVYILCIKRYDKSPTKEAVILAFHLISFH